MVAIGHEVRIARVPRRSTAPEVTIQPGRPLDWREPLGNMGSRLGSPLEGWLLSARSALPSPADVVEELFRHDVTHAVR